MRKVYCIQQEDGNLSMATHDRVWCCEDKNTADDKATQWSKEDEVDYKIIEFIENTQQELL